MFSSRRSELIIALCLGGLLLVDLAYSAYLYGEANSATYQGIASQQRDQLSYSVVGTQLTGWWSGLLDFLSKHHPVITALATVGLVVFTFTLWRATEQTMAVAAQSAAAARAQADALYLAERAYVKLSHRQFLFSFAENKFTMSVEVKNWGRTPARVVGVSLKFEDWLTGNTLPAVPVYAECETREAFLVAAEPFYFEVRDEWRHPEFDPDLRRLLIYGYVDYVDIFGRKYRGGYGRFYSPALSSDLLFIDDPGYNYDKELTG